MKRKIAILLSILIVIALLIPFIPTYHFSYFDGGTTEYHSIMCTYVIWNKMLGTDEETHYYHKLSIFWGKDKNKTIDELWKIEYPVSEESAS